MKRLFTLLASLFAVAGTSAQNPYIALQGVVEEAGGLTVSQPRTVLTVDVEVECDRIVAGPYARYAQKYLAAHASLTDKTLWTVKDVRIALADPDTYLYAGALKEPGLQTYAYADAAEEFPRMQADKNSVQVLTLEGAASSAANTIYSLRRHRMDLITGEAGENVFGGGLQAALDEINRLEQSYLELFLGKRTISTRTYRFIVKPQADKLQYVVCRLSATDGLLPASDLSGDLVMLKIEPSEPNASGLAAPKQDASTMPCRVAAPSVCEVLCNGQTFGSVTLPIFEFGRTIHVTVPRRK